MVQLTCSEDIALQMLMERMSWPVKMVRWRAVKEISRLMNIGEMQAATHNAFLKWLGDRKLESEVTMGLSVLLTTPKAGLPPFAKTADSISRPSILADFMLEEAYGLGNRRGGWATAHAGIAPIGFEPDQYFLRNSEVHVPPILAHRLQGLESLTGYPFMLQWGHEWQHLMQLTGSPYSGHPFHFVDASLMRSGMTAQLLQRQAEIYYSAYLRTLALAVDQWRMPVDAALDHALNVLPVNRGLVDLEPIDRPEWLASIPDQCCNRDIDWEPLVRELLVPEVGTIGMRPVFLRIPISPAVAEFGSLSIAAQFVTKDYSPGPNEQIDLPVLPLPLPGRVSLEGFLPNVAIGETLRSGASGLAAPACMRIWPRPSGYLHGDYLLAGLPIPAPYCFAQQAHVGCSSSGIEVSDGSSVFASTRIWHDAWSPIRPKDGATRFGSMTEIDFEILKETMDRNRLSLGWHVQLTLWRREASYHEYTLDSRSMFIHE